MAKRLKKPFGKAKRAAKRAAAAQRDRALDRAAAELGYQKPSPPTQKQSPTPTAYNLTKKPVSWKWLLIGGGAVATIALVARSTK